MNRTPVMIGILVVLLGIAGYLWSTSAGTEVDQRFETMKQTYNCPHCGGTFELTGAESTQLIEAHGSIICPLCSKDIEDLARATANPIEGGAIDEESTEPEDAPPKPTSRMKKFER
jgi:DNA-directed RNA polymerase subunit RPC12/RpoP